MPESFKLLLSFHLFPFLLTYSAHAIGRWATGFKSSGLGLKSFGHMYAHGLSTCALVHTYTWDMSIRQRLVSHGLCLRSAHGPCSCVRCYQLQLWFTLCVTLPTCWTFLLACPITPPSHSQRVLFWKRRLDQADTILTVPLAFNLGIISGNRDSAAQRGGSPVPIMRGQAGDGVPYCSRNFLLWILFSSGNN